MRFLSLGVHKACATNLPIRLRNTIKTVAAAITTESQVKVWEELVYRLDVCRGQGKTKTLSAPLM